MLRFIAYSLAFWFVYRVVVGAFRHLLHDTTKNQVEEEQPRRETKIEEPPNYHDVKDARFKDIPNDSSKPS